MTAGELHPLWRRVAYHAALSNLIVVEIATQSSVRLGLEDISCYIAKMGLLIGHIMAISTEDPYAGVFGMLTCVITGICYC